MDSFCQYKRLAISNETLSGVRITFRAETLTARWKIYTTWSMNSVPTIYPQKLLSKSSLLPIQQTIPRWILYISTTWYNNNLSRLNQLHQDFSLKNWIIVLTMRSNFIKYYNFLKLMMIYMCSCNKMACHYLSGLFKVIM